MFSSNAASAAISFHRLRLSFSRLRGGRGRSRQARQRSVRRNLSRCRAIHDRCSVRDLWLRPDLAPRDRSLVTISALIANGQVAQLTGHIPIGMNNGLTQPEIAEAITHLAFYVGWPNTQQAVQLGLLPRMEIRRTSATEKGQIYIPRVNWLLLIAVVYLTIVFRT